MQVEVSRSFATQPQQGLRLDFAGNGCLPAPICPTQRLTRANRDCFLCIPGDGVLFVNGVVILPLEDRAFLLYAIRPSGRKSGSGPLPGTAAGV